MIIFLSELQKEHLSLLHNHSPQVLIDFCKLTIDYINNGINEKKYALAAEKLEILPSVIQNLVQALAHLILEGCKHNLSEQNFKSSLAIAGFSDDHQQVLVKFYSRKKGELSAALNLLQQKDPTYQDLAWRFEVQMASKSCPETIKPMVTMDYVLSVPKSYDHSNDKHTHRQSDDICISSSVEDAKAASHCQNVVKHVIMQCDLPTLVHLTNTLNEAVNESKSQHIRKIQRAL
ncbi:COMM domain-containing protein 2-like [Pieris brassicae]|uniref:COMM domain-containing protein n=1 Tax=Pieris brassicae TaxID=7116 RepID=A0A9P0TLN9_PIEBR|nr:COMM domain-containing protein 2-like [Pieris brassicae]CAH4030804.1 unnamed protein product [Pieris brassicae]